VDRLSNFKLDMGIVILAYSRKGLAWRSLIGSRMGFRLARTSVNLNDFERL